MQLSFVHLPQHKHLLQPAGSFSLLQESIGAMRLAYFGLQAVPPSLYIDTTGAAFSFLPAYCLFGCRVMAYVHYPTISTDMLQLVWDRRFDSNHDNKSSSSTLRSYAKLAYYLGFASLYGAIGSLTTTLVLVNSTWTYNHIRSLWRGARGRVRIVYPPCSIPKTKTQTSRRSSTPDTIVSVGQFRPEKDHALQIRAVQRLQQLHPDVKCRLVLLGSCRNDEDAARLEALRKLAAPTTGSSATIEFVVNAPSATLQEWLTQKAHVGLHTMWNEHFGIGIVEMMAAGLVVVAHKSGGPQTDIIAPGRSGWLASTVDEYAAALYTALTMSPGERATMQRNAQASAERFTDEVFEEAILKAMGDLHVIGG